jgi:hypothetical protein
MFVTLAWAGFGFAAFLALVFVWDWRNQAARLATLRAKWGLLVDRDRDMASIAAYHHACTPSESVERALEDRAWEDLNMNDVFAVLDRTESVVGQQRLYARLRATPHVEDLAAFEALVTQIGKDARVRERAQLVLGRLRAPTCADLWRLAQPGTLKTAPWQFLYPVVGVCMVGVIVLVPFWHPALIILVAGIVGNLLARASVARQLGLVTRALRHVSPLVAAAEVLSSLAGDATAPIIGTLRLDAARLSRLRRLANWAGRDPTGAIVGDLRALLFESLNMVFWLDANALFFGGRELAERAPELLRVIAGVGEVDAAISVASYRAGTPGWTRPVFKPAGTALLNDIRHPLLADAVPNSITLTPPHGVIVTGSNMSGKSTFLRTVGVTTVLAQTINTCLASRYEAPLFAVRTCIGRGDDPRTGKSYYLVEVESVLALVHAGREPVPLLLLFDELFRGTNAVERIAAGEAVLLSLLASSADGRPSPHIVLVATHDQELVDLLDTVYAPYHFAETIDAGGLTFDYKLQVGVAETRNAIALLAQRGAPPDLVAHALARAQSLDGNRPAIARELGLPAALS